MGYSRHLTSGSVSSGEVSALDHEFLDDSVEFASFVAKSFLYKLAKHKQLKLLERDNG